MSSMKVLENSNHLDENIIGVTIQEQGRSTQAVAHWLGLSFLTITNGQDNLYREAVGWVHSFSAFSDWAYCFPA